MSTERIIHLADLSAILGSLRVLQNDIGTVSGQVESVGQELNTTRNELSQLVETVANFIAADLKAKELALAEMRQVKIRQEIETTFGYYAIVRRQATGILQAADVSLVRKETLRGATEELMLSAPRYWLAPALVALTAWLGDNKDLATRALAEAIRRDDEKTSLFFALIARRAGRAKVNSTWLDRYFGLRDPYKLDRQTVVMLDAMANGIFGADVSMQCSKRVTAWIEELSQRSGFVEMQRTQWGEALRSKAPNNNHSEMYPHLSRYSPTWTSLNTSLNGVAMHSVVLTHFNGIFQGQIKPAPSILFAVDDLLTKLVTKFDDEELPLRRKEQLCSLIIEENGDKRTAQSRYDLQSKALDELVDFTQLLTNAAMHPEKSQVTRATQRFAIAHSRDWIVDAHEDVAARVRMNIPSQVELSIEDWIGITTDGRNELELLSSISSHLQERESLALSQIKLGMGHWAGVVFGVILLLMSFSSGFIVFLMGAACLTWAFIAYRKLEGLREKLKADYLRLQEQSAQLVRAFLAEVVELRRDIVNRDKVAADVTAALKDITPEQYILSSHDSVRRVMAAA